MPRKPPKLIDHFYSLEPHAGPRGFTGRSNLADAIYQSKHKRDPQDFAYVTARMASRAKKIKRPVSCVTSVPGRDSGRAYSLKLARAIAKEIKCPYKTPRRVNPGETILIVDDVLQTGRTVRRVARKILHKAASILVLTATRGIRMKTGKRRK